MTTADSKLNPIPSISKITKQATIENISSFRTIVENKALIDSFSRFPTVGLTDDWHIQKSIAKSQEGKKGTISQSPGKAKTQVTQGWFVVDWGLETGQEKKNGRSMSCGQRPNLNLNSRNLQFFSNFYFILSSTLNLFTNRILININDYVYHPKTYTFE